jgi:hypothetical protein
MQMLDLILYIPIQVRHNACTTLNPHTVFPQNDDWQNMDSMAGIGSLEECSPGLKNVLCPVHSGPLYYS